MATNHDVLAQLYYDGDWHHLSTIVHEATGVLVERGSTDEGEIKPGKCTWRIIDDDDLYRPSNAASALYGQLTPYMRGAFATGGTVRFTGEVQSFQPGQSPDFQEGPPLKGWRWVDVTVAGAMGRVGRWRDALASPLFTQISNYSTLRGYWPGEELAANSARRLTNAVAGGRPGYATGVEFAQSGGPAGAARSVKIPAGATIGGGFLSNSPTAGWQFAWAANVVTDATERTTMRVETSAGYTWRWKVSQDTIRLTVTNSSGVALLDAGYTHGTGADPGQPISTRWKVTQIGANVEIQAGWFTQDSNTLYGFTETFAGSVGALVRWGWTGETATADSLLGHVVGLTGTADNLQSNDFLDAFNGHNGETTVERFIRLCDLRDLPYQVLGDTSRATRMGPQPAATFQDQLKEIVLTEGGLMFDRASNNGLILATREYLYEQTAGPALELVWPDDVAPGLLEETTGADLYNDITVKDSTSGASARRQLADGPYGMDTIGQVDRTVTVNLSDLGELEPMAEWWLARYTVEGPRFRELTVDLDDHPELAAGVHAMGPGMVIRLTGRTPDPLLLMVVRISERVQRKRNRVTFSLVPADVFDLAIFDDAGSRWDLRDSVTVGTMDADAGDTTLTTHTPAAAWGTQTPYDVIVAGERMTVTAVAAAGVNQNLTVTRAANGILKAHAADEPVHLAPGKRYGI